ncbi:FtsH protease activity modulator HflK [Sandarakinorhabdus sp.]|uniref:FtsH protease activity modulator HflK n=1 Tax=Sandarakinorhabdus sp. TaxID=1916663 RepID=UPI00286DDDAA|nr:FtsH protease activity modulator HflK [Sandarakinorhabdus sp.]
MPWQNNNDDGPWGGGSESGGNGGTGGGTGGGSGGGPKNPWGDGPKRPPGPRPSGNREFDDIIRRGQEKLRSQFGGGGNGGGGLGGSNFDLGNGKALPWIGAAVIATWIVLTSFYRVDAQERAVVQRFGRYVDSSGPGMHFKLPWPIDAITLRKVEEIRSIDIGASDGATENLMLTGDQNIINLAYAVRWKIKNPELYLFELVDPEQTVREVAESAMRAEISKASLNDAIGPQRAQIAEQVRERMQELLDSYRGGIEVRGVDIRQADPPAAVDDAFKDVSAAQQDAQQYMNQARTYSQRLLAQAQGAAAAFDAVYTQYRLAPEVTRKRMYLETMESVLSKVDKTVVDTGNVQTYLPLPELRKRSAAAPEASTR